MSDSWESLYDTDNLLRLTKSIHTWCEADYKNLQIKTADKYRIINLFLERGHRKTIKTAVKNHARLKKDNMTYLLTEAIVKLFLGVCKLYDTPLTEYEKQSKVSTGAFKRLIEGYIDEIEELEDEIENLKSKNLKGYILESEHDKEVWNLEQQINELKKDREQRLRACAETEKFYHEKLQKERVRHMEKVNHLSKEFDKVKVKEILDY